MPFVKPMGIRVAEARKGFVSVRMKPQQSLFNQMATYQAGSLFTLAEVAGGLFCGTFLDLSKNFLITKKSEILFERATSEELVAESLLAEEAAQKVLAELAERKKIDFPVEVHVKTISGEPILACRFVYYLRMGIPRSFLKH